MRPRNAAAAVFWLACAATGGAETKAPTALPSYTLEQCVAIGLERATLLLNARRDEGIADAQARQTKAQVYPQLSTEAAYTRKDEVPTFPGAEGDAVAMGSEDNYSASASLSQILYSGGKVNAAIRAARRAKEYAAFGTDAATRRLVRDIRLSFYEILLAQARVSVREDAVRQLEDFVAQTEKKYASGTAAEFDLLSARVRLANERPNLVAAKDVLAVLKEQFRNLIYLEEAEYGVEGELAFEPVEADLAALQAQGEAARPDVRQMDAYVRLLQEDVRAARGDYYPEIRALASYVGTDPDATSFGPDAGWGWHWSAGVAARWSILDGGLRRGVVLEKALNLAKARSEYDDLKRAARLGVKQAYLDMMHAREALAGAEENVTLAEKALSIAKTRYEQGLSTYLEFTESNVALREARLTRLTALKAHMAAVTALRYASGSRDPFLNEEQAP